VEVTEALSDLMELSSQVEAAVVLDGAGTLSGSTLAAGSRAEELARAARELLAAAERVRARAGSPPVSQLEAATRRGSVFVIRGECRTIAATTAPSPTTGLVLYDLKTCLRALGDEEVEQEPQAAEVSGAEGGDAAA
jgi:predicted regulator of Ras-like GTPase activity (Roadblock/LC7/MglB family)